jgi:hypothetical protein
MAKGQMRSNRETKKPKADKNKAKTSGVVSAFQAAKNAPIVSMQKKK